MKKNIYIDVVPGFHQIPVKTGTSVLKIAQDLGIELKSDCGGNGTCGKCQIKVEPPDALSSVTQIEENFVTASELEKSQRLACQADVLKSCSIQFLDANILNNTDNGKKNIHGQEDLKSERKDVISGSLGIALDIGTTTIAAYACDLSSGEILSSHATANPQQSYGADVISRISIIREDVDLLRKLRHIVVDAVNGLIKSCIDRLDRSLSDVADITIVGNTTMQHIIAGLNPAAIGVSPYQPETKSAAYTTAKDMGFCVEPSTPVYVFPVISGFLGGDILAAYLADLSNNKNENRLIIDIGTNGELILITAKEVWATSCATGPAFEGAQITCGMRAVPGAIYQVTFNDQTNQVEFLTIEEKPPLGICGSGIIDTAAAFCKAKIIETNGRFSKTDNAQERPHNFQFKGSDIRITLKDIRQIQLAKSALYVGIDTLLRISGVESVDQTILTGAFGARFNWRNARDIGMLPIDICKNQVSCHKNLAGKGAIIALLDLKKRSQIEQLAKQIHSIDLAAEPDFIDRFSKATQFPEPETVD